MKIHFGLALDGQRARKAENRLGEPLLGPLGFLDLLEGMLGLQTKSVSQAVRITQYRDCLERANIVTRFYSKSFATDPLGTAAGLLSWRDQWHLHGWERRFPDTDSPRLRDMDAVEALASVSVAPSIGERLKTLLTRMEGATLPACQVMLHDPLEAFPARWQAVLNRLPIQQTASLLPVQNCLLGELQQALFTSLVGENPSPVSWREDGSLRVIRAETRLTAARWLAAETSAAETLIVAQADATLLDRSFEAAGIPLIGLKEHSAFRPALQLLPLVLAMLWQPADIRALVKFLSHPVCPIWGFARRQLAAKLAGSPGIGGALWQKALDKIVAHYGDKAGEVIDSIRFWIECERFAPQSGVPVEVVAERVARLAAFFRTRLKDDQSIESLSVRDAHAQCADVLATLGKHLAGLHLSPAQLEKLLAQATARGSGNPQLRPQVGACRAIDNPAAAITPADEVVWWQLEMPALPVSPLWSCAELEQLAAAGVILPSMDEQLQRLSADWARPILAARHRLTLILPPAGTEVHPLWQMIETLISDIPVQHVETCLADTRHAELPLRPLPARRRWWQLEPGSIPLREKESHSSVSIFLNNPYQWVLRYPAALNLSQTLDVADGPRLFGLVAHRTVERFFTETPWQSFTHDDITTWFEKTFPAIIDEEGAVLRLAGRRADLARCHYVILRALQGVRQHCREANVVNVASEMDLAGHYVGGSIGGSADLVATQQDGRQAIIDMKWSGEKIYPEKLKKNTHLQLAIYAELLRQKTGTWPTVGYFILNTARLFAHAADNFPNAVAAAGKDGNQTPNLWQQFGASWRWRHAQIEQGAIEVVMPSTEADDASVPGEDCIPMDKRQADINAVYNDFIALAGWEAGR